MPSRHVTVGPERAPHRSIFYSMGVTDEQIAQPIVGVATTWNEAAPCNISLSRQAQAAKKRRRGGRRHAARVHHDHRHRRHRHGPCRHEIVAGQSREVIADSVELTMRGHCYDALVGLAGCDKSLPGLMMAMLRLNVPSVFMYGGSILPGRFKGRDVTIVDVFEGVGAHSVGTMTDEELHELECDACPSSGSCGGQFTANTMACVSEAIGLALPGSAGTPAPYDSRDAYAEASGEAVMELLAPQPAAARHRHAQGARKRGDGRRRLRRLDQWRAASAGDRQRGRHRFRPARRSARSSSARPISAISSRAAAM